MDKRLEKIFDNYNPNRGSFCGYFLTSLRNYCVDMCRGKARLVLLGQNNPQTPQQQGNDPWADFLRALRDQVLCDWIPEKSWDTLCREFQTILTEIIALSEGNIKQFFECLKHCTEQLEPRQCQVWVMRHALDMSPPNISNELRITKEYVRVIIAQANHKLRRCMAECFSPVVIDSSNK
jgi:RNA polymerase sigma factor (sigma-70 family)